MLFAKLSEILDVHGFGGDVAFLFVGDYRLLLAHAWTVKVFVLDQVLFVNSFYLSLVVEKVFGVDGLLMIHETLCSLAHG